MTVTGLQASELLKSKKFYPYPDDPFAFLFSSTITKTKECLITLVNAEDVLEAIAHSQGLKGSQAAIFHSLIDWVEKHLEQEAKPVEAQPNQSILALTEQAKTLTWLTGEITTLREPVIHLEQERDDLKSQLA